MYDEYARKEQKTQTIPGTIKEVSGTVYVEFDNAVKNVAHEAVSNGAIVPDKAKDFTEGTRVEATINPNNISQGNPLIADSVSIIEPE